MELDTAYHYCSEIQVSVRIFQWKEKWVIFLLLTNWILSRWHGEKACWTHINNSRRLSNPCNPGVISRSRTHHPPSQVLPKFPYKHCWMGQSIKLISSDFGQVKEMIDKYPKCFSEFVSSVYKTVNKLFCVRVITLGTQNKYLELL